MTKRDILIRKRQLRSPKPNWLGLVFPDTEFKFENCFFTAIILNMTKEIQFRNIKAFC